MIGIENISHSYAQQPVLLGVSLTVAEGEFLGVVGPNSSGKTTLLRLITRSRRLQQGRIEIDGQAIESWSLRALAQQVAVVPAENFFVFPFTADHIVLMGRTPHQPNGWKESDQDRAIVQHMMEATDTWTLRARPVSQLSSGERQRVLLARALAQEPKILILDEPTAHLDIGHEWDFFNLLQGLHKEKHLTILCVLHDLTLAARYCDRLAVLHQGKLHSTGRPEEVLTPDTLRQVYGIDAEVRWSARAPFSALTLQPAQRNTP